MAKRSCRDFFCNFWKVARGIFGNISKIRGVFLKIHGLRLDYKKIEGPFCKFPGIIDFQIYFSMEKSRWTQSMAHGPAQGTVHGGPTTMAGHRARWSSAEQLLRGTVAHWR
jgi:hypothetical protein